MTETLEQRAVVRCADEMGRSLLYLRAIRGLVDAETYHAIDFIRLAYWALYDQMLTHVIRVLDDREEAGFWFLTKGNAATVEALCSEHGLSLAPVEVVQHKLKKIRDKTHLHLDKQGVLDPKQVWRAADLSYGELESAMETAFRLLALLHQKLRGAVYELPEYDGADATALAKMASMPSSSWPIGDVASSANLKVTPVSTG
jgi:hypothetical protein